MGKLIVAKKSGTSSTRVEVHLGEVYKQRAAEEEDKVVSDITIDDIDCLTSP